MTAQAQNRENRILPLDGLRGLAATIVFAHHALALLYGPLAGINDSHWPLRPKWLATALRCLPIGWMFNGAFAVSFFFVLSGFVLTLAVGADPKPSRMARLVGARLLRLAPLVVLGTLAGFFLFDVFVQNLDLLHSLAGNGSSAYIDPSLLHQHDIWQAIKQMTAIIWRGTRAETLFDPPLWSIGIELQGSLLVYMVSSVFCTTRKQYMKFLIGAGVGLCLIGLPAISFLAGMFIAERYRDTGEVLHARPALLLALMIVALIWASVHPWDRHLWLPLPFNPPEMLDTVISTLGSMVLIACGLQLQAMRYVLQARPIRLLGDASYGLYVTHVPILYACAAPLLRSFKPYMTYGLAVFATSTVLLATSVALGWVLVAHIDTPLARWSKQRMTHWLG